MSKPKIGRLTWKRSSSTWRGCRSELKRNGQIIGGVVFGTSDRRWGWWVSEDLDLMLPRGEGKAATEEDAKARAESYARRMLSLNVEPDPALEALVAAMTEAKARHAEARRLEAEAQQRVSDALEVWRAALEAHRRYLLKRLARESSE